MHPTHYAKSQPALAKLKPADEVLAYMRTAAFCLIVAPELAAIDAVVARRAGGPVA